MSGCACLSLLHTRPLPFVFLTTSLHLCAFPRLSPQEAKNHNQNHPEKNATQQHLDTATTNTMRHDTMAHSHITNDDRDVGDAKLDHTGEWELVDLCRCHESDDDDDHCRDDRCRYNGACNSISDGVVDAGPAAAAQVANPVPTRILDFIVQRHCEQLAERLRSWCAFVCPQQSRSGMSLPTF